MSEVMTIEEGTIKRIHVNQSIIKRNMKEGRNDPVFTVKHGGKTYYGEKVLVNGFSQVVYKPESPLSCGAHVWIETTATIVLEGVTTFAEQDEQYKLECALKAA